MKSMTGYGRGESAQEGMKVTVEVSSVNRRQAEFAVSLPRELEGLEPLVREEAAKAVARGRLTIRLAAELGPDADVPVRVNHALARSYLVEMRALAAELGMPGNTVTLDMVMRAPGVLQSLEGFGDVERFAPVVRRALAGALKSMLAMRTREGGALAKDLERRLVAMRRAVKRIQRRAPAVQQRYLEGLRERLTQAGLNAPTIGDDRLAKEIVLFADRSDVAEELARLESHFQQVEDCLASSEPVGRPLDFLAQEMNREINTVGSKANDSGISKEIVLLKTELERFREQVQNVE
jgi:uncharacterized protein (TIGR00255 family)